MPRIRPEGSVSLGNGSGFICSPGGAGSRSRGRVGTGTVVWALAVKWLMLKTATKAVKTVRRGFLIIATLASWDLTDWSSRFRSRTLCKRSSRYFGDLDDNREEGALSG
jgi:hypothetical protein